MFYRIYTLIHLLPFILITYFSRESTPPSSKNWTRQHRGLQQRPSTANKRRPPVSWPRSVGLRSGRLATTARKPSQDLSWVWLPKTFFLWTSLRVRSSLSWWTRRSLGILSRVVEPWVSLSLSVRRRSRLIWGLGFSMLRVSVWLSMFGLQERLTPLLQ